MITERFVVFYPSNRDCMDGCSEMEMLRDTNAQPRSFNEYKGAVRAVRNLPEVQFVWIVDLKEGTTIAGSPASICKNWDDVHKPDVGRV